MRINSCEVILLGKNLSSDWFPVIILCLWLSTTFSDVSSVELYYHIQFSVASRKESAFQRQKERFQWLYWERTHKETWFLLNHIGKETFCILSLSFWTASAWVYARFSRSFERFVSLATSDGKWKTVGPGDVILDENRKHSLVFGSKSTNKWP